MRQIIYASSCVDAMTPLSLTALSTQANRNNAQEGITGMLLYGDHLFFQVLEGPDDKIEDMKKRIWEDSRHSGITELKDVIIDERSFAEWSMGCFCIRDVSEGTEGHWPMIDIDSIADRMPKSATPDVIVLARAFFKSIVREKAV